MLGSIKKENFASSRILSIKTKNRKKMWTESPHLVLQRTI